MSYLLLTSQKVVWVSSAPCGVLISIVLLTNGNEAFRSLSFLGLDWLELSQVVRHMAISSFAKFSIYLKGVGIS